MQHEDFNGFLLWSCYVLEPQLGRVMKEALDFATFTGLCEVQGILPDLPGNKTTSQLDNTKRFNSRWPRLDAGALVDPAPFGGIVFVAVVLEDTAALVVLQEVLSETGLRHRACFQKRMFMTCPCSFIPQAVNCFDWKYLTGHGIIGLPLNQYKSFPQ